MKNYKLLYSALVGITLSAGACGKSESKTGSDTLVENSNSKEVVVYFSASGITEKQAERLGGLINAPVYEIKPSTPYTEEDLNWRDDNSRSSLEHKDSSIRPEIADSIPNLANYEVIYLGFPNWWNTYPNIIASFIESNKDALSGKILMPFSTSGGSSIDNSVKMLKENFSYLKVQPGLLMNDVTDDQIKAWAENN